MSADGIAAAWALTRAIAPRRYVNTMIAEADGVIRSNRYPRKFPVIGHMPPSTPWTIDLTDELGRFRFAAFDLDAKRPEDHDQAAEDLGVLVRILRSVNVDHVVCRSSPTGGYHVWVPLAGVEKAVLVQLAAAARAVLPSLDHGLLCNDRTGAARPPLTPHARGGASSVMEGDVAVLSTGSVTASDLLRVTAALRELRPAVDPADEQPSGPVDAAHQAHRSLPAWGAAHMATVAGGRDPSHTGYLCLLAAAVSGWTLADVAHAARTAPGMEHYRTRNSPAGGREPRTPADTAARLARQFAKAQDRATRYRYAPQERAQRDLTELRSIIASTEAMLTAFRVSPGRWHTPRPTCTTAPSSPRSPGSRSAPASATSPHRCAPLPSSPASPRAPSTGPSAASATPDGSSDAAPQTAPTRPSGGCRNGFPQQPNTSGHFKM